MKAPKAHRESVRNMVADVCLLAEVPFKECSDRQRQALAAFAYGMLISYGLREELAPEVVRSLQSLVLVDVLNFPENRATIVQEELDKAARFVGPPLTVTIVPWGCIGHTLWREGQKDQIKAILKDMLKAAEE